MRTIRGQVRRPEGGNGSYAGHRVLLSYQRDLPLGETREQVDAHAQAHEAASAPLAADGAFTLSIADDNGLHDDVELAVLAPTGALLGRTQLTLRRLGEPLTIVCAPAQPFVIRPAQDPLLGRSARLTGRVIGMDGTPAAAGLHVVIWGLGIHAGAVAQPLLRVPTQLGGYFSGPWPAADLAIAYGEVNGTGRTAISLADGRLPQRVVLVVTLPSAPADECDCAPAPPRAPDAQDLAANPAAYSQDLGGGCVSLTMPNRVLEEYAYFTVVRTTEPDVRPMNTDAPTRLPEQVRSALIELVTGRDAPDTAAPVVPILAFADAAASSAAVASSTAVSSAAVASTAAEVPAAMLAAIDTRSALEMLAQPETISARGLMQAALKSEALDLRRLIEMLQSRPSRSDLDAAHAIDWDLSPTVYEAVTVALGHVLHYRQTWRADGYSLGDLLYSLPLAPGQKRLVSMLDWTRRSTGSRTEYLESEERMQALTERDRDITEIVGSDIDERIDGGSTSSGSAGGGGIGFGFMSGAFGVLAGVAGGASGSNSSSWQDAARNLSGSSLQQVRDRTNQRASAVRNTRSTVIQAVAQDESSRAETDVVANHNHCHALTVEYFEVLRHFQVSEELAYVSECVFVPLPMLPFDQPKTRRWRASLAGWLRRPDLAPGFDAIERIATNWDGWDYPEHRFSEEPAEELDGELRMRFVIPRPHDKDDGAFDIDRWTWVAPLLSQSPFAVFNMMADHVNGEFRDINRKITAEFYTQIQRARDLYFAREVAPLVAEQIVHRMRFAYVTRAGAQVALPLEASLVSKYVDGVPLYVSIRAAGALPALPREDIARFRIYLTPNLFGIGTVPVEARILVTSGRARYRTPHLTGLLFDETRIDNDLGEDDHVIVATPTTRAERRDPRAEDRHRAAALVAHLNEQLEFYHQVLWMTMDPQRRYMLLDGIVAPNAGGRSVASVVENRLIGIVGNSLVLPVTPGIHLDPTLAPDPETGERLDLAHAYAAAPAPPTRISVPTRGVYAEAIMGECNACEKKDDTRYWRWEESPLPDEPTPIEPISTASRQEAGPDMNPTPLPAPIVNIQNAPGLPDPMGLGQALEILGRADIFRDASGLAGTQRNALAAFQGVMDTARAFGGMAAQLAQQQEMGRNVDRTMDQIKQAQASGMLSPQQAQALAHTALQALVGDPGTANQNPVHDPEVSRAIEKALEAQSGSVTVSSPGETVHASFADETAGIGIGTGTGGATVPETLELSPWITLPMTPEQILQGPPIVYQKQSAHTDMRALRRRSRALSQVGNKVFLVDYWKALTDPAKGWLRQNPGAPGQIQLRTRLRVVLPAAAGNPGKVAGSGPLPLAVLMHGNHASWGTGTAHDTGPDIMLTLPDGTTTVATPQEADTLAVSDSHAGYAYLQDYLASQGIMSVSIDANFCNFYGSLVETRADLILKALDVLKKESARAGSPLAGRIDFSRVGLMGHSRGGDAVVAAAKKVAGMVPARPYDIKAVCSLAPTDFTGGVVPADRTFLNESDTGFYLVVYGALDGDVSGFDGPDGIVGTGFRHYDRARCPKAMAFFKKCCHNSFNTVWHADGLDSADPRTLDPDAKTAPLNHEMLATEYIGELFRWKLLGHKLAGRFDGRTANSAGAEVSLQWVFGAVVKHIEDFESTTTNLLGGGHAVLNLAPHFASLRDETRITHGGMPGTPFGLHMPHQSTLLQMEWAPMQIRPFNVQALASDVPSPHQDWSMLDTLLVSIGGWYDSSSDASIAASPLPRVRVTLVDAAGSSGVAHFNNYGNQVPTRPIRAVKDNVDLTLMPVETVPIPLALFAGIDLHQVKLMTLELEPAGADTTFVDNIHVVKRES